MVKTPDIIPPISAETPEEAVEQAAKIYNAHVEFLRDQFQAFVDGKVEKKKRIRACYPYARIATKYARRADTRLSYGFAPRPGVYSTTLTRPDIFDHYYLQQFENLLQNHDVPIEIGVSLSLIHI